jgi:uncharacterized protein (DUF58 family)
MAKAALLDPDFLRKLERLSIVSKKVFTGKIKGERKSKKKGLSVEFADYRDYAQGDDLRFVDWNIFGRLEELFVKLFMEEEDLYFYLIVDASKSMDFGEPLKMDFAKRVAAALAYVALAGLDRVSVSAFSSTKSFRLAPMRGKSQVWRLFSFINDLEPEGETHLARALKDFVLTNTQKGVAVVISDFFDRDGYEEALKYLLHRKFDVFVVQVLSPQELSPTLTGHLKLLDSETTQYVEMSASRAVFKTYKKTLDSFTGELRDFCLSRGIGYILASSATPFDRLVLRYLRRLGLVK